MSWNTKKLKEVCDFQSGLWKGKKEPFTSAYVIRNTNFTKSGELSFDDVAELEVESKQMEKRTLQPGDIILEKSGGGERTPVGRVCYFNKESEKPISLSNFTARLRVRDRNELYPLFLHRFLYALYFSGKTETMQKHSTGIRNLQLTQYKEIDIPLPSLSVQKQIVEKLDAAFVDIDKSISATEKNIENTEALFQEFLNRIYENNNWRQISLGEYYDVRDGTHDSPKYVENGFPLITSKNLKNGRLDFKKIKLITEEDFKEINKRSKVDSDDVLMAMIGTIGNPVVIDNDVNFAIKNVALFKTDSEQSGDFLAYYLRTSNVKNKMSSDSKGTTQKFVGLGYLRNFPITIPDNYEKQLEVVKEIKNFEVLYERLKRNYLTKSNSLEALKTSILNQALSGELTKDAA